MSKYLNLHLLEASLNYFFKNKDLLLEAMSHPSLRQLNQKNRFDYERLEFLGDAILNYIITDLLFNDFKDIQEGMLAKIRAYLVCTQTLCLVAKDLNLANYIIMSAGEENSGGRDNPSNLENAAEALIAAIYLDSGIERVRGVITSLWAKYLDNIGSLSDHDPKTHLQERSQKEGLGVPIYETIEKTGSAHQPLFTIKVTVGKNYSIAKGKSLKIAQKEAARKLLSSLNKKNG